MAGKNVGDQRLCLGDEKGILVGCPGGFGKAGSEKALAVFPAKALVEHFSGKYNAFVKILHQLADFLHVPLTVSAAEEFSAGREYPVHLPADPGNVLAVEQHMVGNDQVKGAVLKGERMAVKGGKGKTGIVSAESASGIADHSI